MKTVFMCGWLMLTDLNKFLGKLLTKGVFYESIKI